MISNLRISDTYLICLIGTYADSLLAHLEFAFHRCWTVSRWELLSQILSFGSFSDRVIFAAPFKSTGININWESNLWRNFFSRILGQSWMFQEQAEIVSRSNRLQLWKASWNGSEGLFHAFSIGRLPAETAHFNIPSPQHIMSTCVISHLAQLLQAVFVAGCTAQLGRSVEIIKCWKR